MRGARSEHEPWFVLLEAINRDAMALLFALKPRRPSTEHLLGSLIYGRMLQALQAALLVASRGMIPEARALVRLCCESAIALGGVADIPNFFDLLVAGDALHKSKLINAMTNDPRMVEVFPHGELDRFRSVGAEIAAEYGGDPNDVNWAAVAAQSKLDGIYNSIYRPMSADGAHISLESLQHHVRATEDGAISSLSFAPSTEALRSTLAAAVSCSLTATEVLSRIFDSEDARAIVARHLPRFKELSFAE